MFAEFGEVEIYQADRTGKEVLHKLDEERSLELVSIESGGRDPFV